MTQARGGGGGQQVTVKRQLWRCAAALSACLEYHSSLMASNGTVALTGDAAWQGQVVCATSAALVWQFAVAGVCQLQPSAWTGGAVSPSAISCPQLCRVLAVLSLVHKLDCHIQCSIGSTLDTSAAAGRRGEAPGAEAQGSQGP